MIISKVLLIVDLRPVCFRTVNPETSLSICVMLDMSRSTLADGLLRTSVMRYSESRTWTMKPIRVERAPPRPFRSRASTSSRNVFLKSKQRERDELSYWQDIFSVLRSAKLIVACYDRIFSYSGSCWINC